MNRTGRTASRRKSWPRRARSVKTASHRPLLNARCMGGPRRVGSPAFVERVQSLLGQAWASVCHRGFGPGLRWVTPADCVKQVVGEDSRVQTEMTRA